MDFDEAEMDMIRRGDMLGPKLGAKVATALETLQRERDEADNDLVDRYRDPKNGAFSFPADVAAIVRRLERSERDRDEAREALKPFAEAAGAYDPEENDSGHAAWAHDFTIGSLRRARAALSPKEAEE